MRIVICHNHYRQPGGEDAVFASEAALLSRWGHQVSLLIDDNRRLDKMSKVAIFAQTLWSRPSRARLRGLVRHVGPDVAHFHNTFPLISPSAYSACREFGVPVVQTLHNYRLLCPAATFLRRGSTCEDCLGKTLPWPGVRHGCYHDSRGQTAVVAAMLALHRYVGTWQHQVDLYVALTDFARRKFVEGGIPADKIAVKPNFVAVDPGLREGDGAYALFVGRASPEKGVRTLLRAWRSLTVPLRIVGDGPLSTEVVTLVGSGEVGPVKILGQTSREEALTLMKGARFLVFPSECYESFPVTLAEAFACGAPVIASRLGAMAEIVEDGLTGLHFTAGDPEDLAAKVEWAWTHPEAMREMGREARREYEAKYTAERNYEMLMDIYARAMGS